MRGVLLCAALIVGMAGPEAGAKNLKDGNELLVHCRNSTEKAGYSYCLGFVTAVADSLRARPVGAWRACLPKEAPVDQLAEIVIAWLEANPSKRQLASDTITLSALSEAFPCKKAR